MSAVEEIQAAIDKLTASKLNLTACPEFQRRAVRHIARNCEIECDCDDTDTLCGWDRYETAPALDMLIRTIDAQLAILTAAKVDEYEWADEWERIGKPHLRGPAKIVPINRAALDLARAILGLV